MALNGLKSLQKRLESIKGDISDGAEEAVDDAFDATEWGSKRRLIRRDAVHTGQTYRGFVRTKVSTSDGFTAVLGNESPHSKFVEFGTGQRFGSSPWRQMPSERYDAPDISVELISNIARWIETKPSFRRTGGPPRSMAYAISLAIAGHVDGRPSGTDPQPFMRPAWHRGKKKLKRKMRAEIFKALL